MTTAPRDLSPNEAGREAARINHALSKAGFSAAATTQWWNHFAHPELDGRTASQAWLAGEYAAVKAIVERLVSERFAEALQDRPDIARQLLDTHSSS